MKCSSCSVELDPVHEHMSRRNDFPQYQNALVIDFHGAYGMYVDPVMPSFLRAVLCQDCANQLESENPWLHDLFITERGVPTIE